MNRLAATINHLDVQISDMESFKNNMINNGYDELYKDLFVKQFNGYEINVDLRTNCIFAYIDNNTVDIPDWVVDLVEQDIERCNV